MEKIMNRKRTVTQIVKRIPKFFLFKAKYALNLGSYPDFIIIGAQKSGTTSLYDDIAKHPDMIPSYSKEVHYFDNNYGRGPRWYRSHFHSSKKGKITGEATPYYMFHPECAKRIKKDLPNIKILIILRNPVDRAYSHYFHEIRHGRENLSFDEAIKKEKERLSLPDDDPKKDFHHQTHSYLTRGDYYTQIKIWIKMFGKDSILVIDSNDYFKNSQKVMDNIFKFLALKPYQISKTSKLNTGGKYTNMDDSTRKWMVRYYRKTNNRLYHLLKRRFDWDK